MIATRQKEGFGLERTACCWKRQKTDRQRWGALECDWNDCLSLLFLSLAAVPLRFSQELFFFNLTSINKLLLLLKNHWIPCNQCLILFQLKTRGFPPPSSLSYLSLISDWGRARVMNWTTRALDRKKGKEGALKIKIDMNRYVWSCILQCFVLLVVLHHKLLLLYIIHHLLSGRGLGQFGYQPQDENQASSSSFWRVSQGLRRHHSLRCRDRRSRHPKWLGYSRSSQCCSCWNHLLGLLISLFW